MNPRNKKRFIPINNDLIETFKSIKNNHPEYVFIGERGYPLKSIKTPFNKLLKIVEINDFRFHDLRHTFASYFLMNGGDLLALKEILGHSSLQMVMRYAHLASQHKLNMVNNMNGTFSSATYMPPEQEKEKNSL